MPIQQDELKQQLGGILAEQAIAIRQRRKLVEERWLRSRRVWMGFDLERRFTSSDTSSSDYTLPAARRAAERSIVRGVKLLTPNVKWFEMQPMSDDVSDEKLSNVDSYMHYILRKKIKTRSNISQLVRSMFICGVCHQKTSIMVRNGLVWPSQRAVDPFAFYTFPETASTSDEAEVIFEDYLFSYERYLTFVAKGIVDAVPRSSLVKPDWPYHLTERMAYQGITDPTANVDIAINRVGDQLEKTTAGFVSITEMWLSREDRLYQVYILWNHYQGARCVGFIESQYDEPLYRSVIHRALPGELYTNSMMSDIDELDGMQNDSLNKFMDAVDYEQGFIGVNDDMVSRMDSIKAKGRSIWHFKDDPRLATNFVSPPNSSTNQLRAWQIQLGLINSMAGTGTIGEGQPGRNMPRSGNAVNNLVNLSMADIQDVAELIEQEVLTPGLGDIYKVSSTFIPDSQLVRIPGAKGRFGNILKASDLAGDYEFEWVGSLQFQDDAARAQRLMIFLNLMPQLAPMLQQQGYAFDIVELIQMIWRYGLGERGLRNIVVKIAELQQKVQGDTLPAELGQPVQQGQQGAEQATPAGSVPGLKYNLPAVTNGFVQQ